MFGWLVLCLIILLWLERFIVLHWRISPLVSVATLLHQFVKSRLSIMEITAYNTYLSVKGLCFAWKGNYTFNYLFLLKLKNPFLIDLLPARFVFSSTVNEHIRYNRGIQNIDRRRDFWRNSEAVMNEKSGKLDRTIEFMEAPGVLGLAIIKWKALTKTESRRSRPIDDVKTLAHVTWRRSFL